MKYWIFAVKSCKWGDPAAPVPVRRCTSYKDGAPSLIVPSWWVSVSYLIDMMGTVHTHVDFTTITTSPFQAPRSFFLLLLVLTTYSIHIRVAVFTTYYPRFYRTKLNVYLPVQLPHTTLYDNVACGATAAVRKIERGGVASRRAAAPLTGVSFKVTALAVAAKILPPGPRIKIGPSYCISMLMDH